uniref:Uncharacterized protein n=1 Tax=Siphoviridae sp. ctnFV5 TaxID=2823600 RepID=A0A8S5L729_9CAUD|nr:MAG TPA: hypothetical protein [Siphoviridae sp. ctnFV5]
MGGICHCFKWSTTLYLLPVLDDIHLSKNLVFYSNSYINLF